MEWKQEGDYEYVIYERSGSIARITLNRPETMNSGFKLFDDMSQAIGVAEAQDDVKVIIFKGAGRCLSSGAPLDELRSEDSSKEATPGEKEPRASLRGKMATDRHMLLDIWQHMLLCRKITIVQAHGYLLAAALDLFLNCDLLVAAEDCKLGKIEQRLGLAGSGMSPVLVLRIGLTHALDLCLTGRMIDGKEAARIGLVNFAVPFDKLEKTVNNLAEGLSRHSRDGIALGKASRHLLYDNLGVTKGFAPGYVMHTLMTNVHFEEDEFNFFKASKDMGMREAIHARNKLYELLDNPEGK